MLELPSGTVTFLFTDIEGSTSLVQRLGDRSGACSPITAICFESPLKERPEPKWTAVRMSASARSRMPTMLCGQPSRRNGRSAPPMAGRAPAAGPHAASIRESRRLRRRASRPRRPSCGAHLFCSRWRASADLARRRANVLAEPGVAGVSFSDLGEHDLGRRAARAHLPTRCRRSSVGVSASAAGRHRRG